MTLKWSGVKCKVMINEYSSANAKRLRITLGPYKKNNLTIVYILIFKKILTPGIFRLQCRATPNTLNITFFLLSTAQHIVGMFRIA